MMEPPAVGVLTKTALLGLLLATLATWGACRRAEDVAADGQAPVARTPEPAAEAESSRAAAQGDSEPSVAEAAAPPDAAHASPESPAPETAEASGAEGEEPLLALAGRSAEQAEATTDPPDETTDARPPADAPAVPPIDEPAEAEPPREPELPPPLAEAPERLQRLHPDYPVWIDPKRKQVLFVGRVCQRRAPLELFACLRHSKEHESIVSVDTKAYVVHAGLLAMGAEPGKPAQFVPEFVPPTGTEVEVTVVWQDESGRRREARAQDWVRDIAGMYAMFEGVVANQFDEELNLDDQFAAWKGMDYPWVFCGSHFIQDDRTGKQYYQADREGDLICVSNFPSAVLDVPFRSSDSNAALLFEAYTERIPPLGTPVTVILTPKVETGREEQPG